jgi:hypothetical protein
MVPFFVPVGAPSTVDISTSASVGASASNSTAPNLVVKKDGEFVTTTISTTTTETTNILVTTTVTTGTWGYKYRLYSILRNKRYLQYCTNHFMIRRGKKKSNKVNAIKMK